MNHGNQYASEKVRLQKLLRIVRFDLQRARFARAILMHPATSAHYLAQAMAALDLYRYAYARVPASTRRRWRCGK